MFEDFDTTNYESGTAPTSVERIVNVAPPLGVVAYVGAVRNPDRISTEAVLDCVKSTGAQDPVLALIREMREADTTQ